MRLGGGFVGFECDIFWGFENWVGKALNPKGNGMNDTLVCVNLQSRKAHDEPTARIWRARFGLGVCSMTPPAVATGICRHGVSVDADTKTSLKAILGLAIFSLCRLAISGWTAIERERERPIHNADEGVWMIDIISRLRVIVDKGIVNDSSMEDEILISHDRYLCFCLNCLLCMLFRSSVPTWTCSSECFRTVSARIDSADVCTHFRPTLLHHSMSSGNHCFGTEYTILRRQCCSPTILRRTIFVATLARPNKSLHAHLSCLGQIVIELCDEHRSYACLVVWVVEPLGVGVGVEGHVPVYGKRDIRVKHRDGWY